MDIFSANNLAALFALTSLEIVLGIDNIVFLAILVDKLPPEKRAKARVVGLILAMFFRIALLLCISWIMLLTEPWFNLFGVNFAGKNLILLGGGLFLLFKATHEMHNSVEEDAHELKPNRAKVSFAAVIAQIILIDMVFSIDSVVTAVGMVEEIWVMIAAVVIAIIVMLIFSKKISDFITEHPTIKMLALSFLLLVGVMLVADSVGSHIPRGYLYFAMTFSLFVEMMNMKTRKKLERKRSAA